MKTLKQKWFWFSIASAFCWAGFAISARFVLTELPANMMQFFVAAFGFLAFGIVLFATRGFRLEPSKRGALYGTIAGVLLAGGGLALYAAYRGGSNTAVVTTATSLLLRSPYCWRFSFCASGSPSASLLGWLLR